MRRKTFAGQVQPIRRFRAISHLWATGIIVACIIIATVIIGAVLLQSGPVARVMYRIETLRLEYAYTHSNLSNTKAAIAATAIAEMTPLPMGKQTGITASTGPLRVHPANPRYFADANGKIVYLTGSHTWSNFQDNGGSDPPSPFDYAAYLNFLTNHHHNFFRLWTWEAARWSTETADDNYWFNPMSPYMRTGPGMALDGKPKFDLTQLDQTYFDRMRNRIIAAGQREIYVAIVLFNGWSVAAAKGDFGENNPWKGHPFNSANNINGIDGDLDHDNSGEEVHTLANPAITAIQEAYVRKIVETVSDLDNVLYEISNESNGDSTEWQYHMIDYLRAIEATKAKQHPIGMTVAWPFGDNTVLYNSPADWISPNGDVFTPDTATGNKVVLLDTDHLCGICGDRRWVWKAFMRGNNPIFMDGYDGAGYGVGGAGFDFNDPIWGSLRRNLGYTRAYAERIDLAELTPYKDLASTGYCLAKPSAQNAQYLIYAPDGGPITVDLSATAGQLMVEWFSPETGEMTSGAEIAGGAVRTLEAPFENDVVLFLYQ